MPYGNSIRLFLWADIKWLLVWVAFFALFGFAVGQLAIGIILGLLVFICRQWRALYLLHHWVKFRTDEQPPEVNGILSDLSQKFFKVYTAEMQLRETLMTNIQRVRESISALEECVVLIDSKSLIEWWNPAAEQMLSLHTGDEGASILNLIREPAFVRYYKAGDYSQSLTMRSWLDEKRYLQFAITPFGDNDKLMIVADVTRIHSLEAVRKDFVANVSHELRTPLTVFSGYIETFMQQEGLNPAWQRGFAQMHQQATRMNNIVNDLLMLSRLENDQEMPPHERVDMPEMMMTLFDQAQAYNLEYAHVINLHIDSQQCLCGAKKELMSAFTNLIFNAIKYTPNEGEINISWQVVNNQGMFSVSDNGIGIDPKHIDRLTERFYRVDSGRSRETGGTGLGLAIVKHVLYRHNAQLKITSEPDVGSTFSAIFPPEEFC